MDTWGILLIVVGVIVVLTVIWKVMGMAMNVASSGHDRRFRESDLGIAIRKLGDRSGVNDGSVAARHQAAQVLAELLDANPFRLDFDGMTEEELIEGYRISARVTPFPNSVQAAYTITGAAEFDEVEHWSKSDAGISLASKFLALYPKWASSHRAPSLESARLERGRWAMMMIVLEERARRDGLLSR